MADNTHSRTIFNKDFTKQEPILEEGIARAIEIMKTGRLHRYNVAKGETSETSLLEKEFAEYIGRKYCAAFSSCGSSLYIALKCLGVRHGDRVLCNSFTLAPVPGAIENAGAEVVLVDITDNYTLDPEDLLRKIESSGAKYLMLSHMRGHISDMDKIVEICKSNNVKMVEDCAHTLGAKWAGRLTGTFGETGCFSTQTYKHMNSGEGGFLVTDDEDIIAQAILYSGSYMLYESHISRPPNKVFERYKKIIPNFSLRMSNLQAAILRPQLKNLDKNCQRWNDRYRLIEKMLKDTDHIYLPERPPQEEYVASSFQFTLTGISYAQAGHFLEECGERGVELKWFGWKEPKGFTSTFENWQYISMPQELSRTKKVLDFVFDFRLPLTFSLNDCSVIATVVKESLKEVVG